MPSAPTAVVYLADADSQRGAARTIAGLTVLERLLLTAARAGVRTVYLPRRLGNVLTADDLERISRAGISIGWLQDLSPNEDLNAEAGPLLLLPCNIVIDSAAVERLCRISPNLSALSLEETKGSGAPVLRLTPPLSSPLWDRLLRGHAIGEELESEIRQGNVRLISSGGFAMTVTDSQSARLAEARLYQSLGTSLDGWVDWLLNRRCSRLLTKLLVRWPITPNQVSALSLVLGLLGVYGFWNASLSSALIGLCLYQLAVVLDHTDGEIARLKFLESSLGKWLDFSIDTLIHAGLALGIGVTASRLSGLTGTALSIGAAAGVVMSAAVSKVVERHEGHGRLGRLLARMANRDLFYAVVLGSLLSIWAAPSVLPWLVALLAAGSHVYWLMLLLHQQRAVRGA